MLAQLETWLSAEPVSVLYVSHVQEEVQRLTRQLIIIDRGAVRSQGATDALLSGGVNAGRGASDQGVGE